MTDKIISFSKAKARRPGQIRLVAQKSERVKVAYLPNDDILRFGDKSGTLRHTSPFSKIRLLKVSYQKDLAGVEILQFGTLLEEQCVPFGTFLQWAMMSDLKRLEDYHDQTQIQYRLKTLGEWHFEVVQVFNHLKEVVLVPWEIWKQAW